MSQIDKESLLSSDDAVEELLGQAAPRPTPPDADTEAVRKAVHAEWQKVTTRRRSRVHWTRFGVAASILIAVLFALDTLRINGVEPVQVATIDKQFGLVRVIGEDSFVLQSDDLARLVVGQVLDTGLESGIGLTWGAGGSLRLDANTRVNLVSETEVFLASGRIYFDSEPALTALPGADAKLTIQTEFGEVSHVGTQYMAHADTAALTISVREGEVEVRPARGGVATAGRSQQIAVSSRGTSNFANIRTHGSAWQWIEKTSPETDLDGRSVHEFLNWVSRETGMALSYENEVTESFATQELLRGRLATGPREALEFWMLGTDLEWRIDAGVIYVNKAQ